MYSVNDTLKCFISRSHEKYVMTLKKVLSIHTIYLNFNENIRNKNCNAEIAILRAKCSS